MSKFWEPSQDRALVQAAAEQGTMALAMIHGSGRTSGEVENVLLDSEDLEELTKTARGC